MIPPPSAGLVSFTDVAFKGRYRVAFVLLAFLSTLGIVAGAALLPYSIPDTQLTGTDDTADIVVPDYSAQPVKVRISHSYTLRLPYGYDEFEVVGVDLFAYGLVFTGEDGAGAAQEYSEMEAPGTHSFGKYSRSDDVTVTKEHRFTLRPGTYTLTLDSEAPVDVVVVQTSMYVLAGTALVAMGILCIVLLFGLTWLALRKRDAMRRSQVFGAVSPNLAPDMSYYGPPGAPVPAVTQPPPAPAAATPLPPDPRRSSLQYVSGQFYAETYCNRCGRRILRAPMNGVLTCETCGEKGYLM